MIIAGAPGKVVLFGEYASLFGYKSIGMAVNRFVEVQIAESSGSLKIGTDNAKNKIEIKSLEDYERYKKRYTYVQEAIKYIFKNEIPNIDITIKLKFPASSGIGSSSALLIAVVGALYKYKGINVNIKKIIEDAKKIEEKVKGQPLCYTDFVISAVGGVVSIDNKKFTYKKLNIGELPLYLKVVKRREIPSNICIKKIIYFYKYFGWAKASINAIGLLVEEAEDRLKEKNLISIGRLMTINHNLLKNLYLTNSPVDLAVNTAIRKGAYGAKITGAGGGGSIIYLSEKKIFLDSQYIIPCQSGLEIIEK